jgi:hypothetical protein
LKTLWKSWESRDQSLLSKRIQITTTTFGSKASSILVKIRCHAVIETSGPVWSVASQGNMIYTAGNKTISVFSLDTHTCISEINAHNSAIKAMALWPEK